MRKDALTLFDAVRKDCGAAEWKKHRRYIDEYHRIGMCLLEWGAIFEYRAIQPVVSHDQGTDAASNEEKRKILEICGKIFELLCVCDNEMRKSIRRNSQNELRDEVIERVVSVLNAFDRFIGCIRNEESIAKLQEDTIQRYIAAALCIDFPDVRREEPTPSVGAGWARMDFMVMPSGVVVECKVTRRGFNEKKLLDELILDTFRYRRHHDCKGLICFIYDAARRLRNRAQVIRDIERNSRSTMKIVVCIRP